MRKKRSLVTAFIFLWLCFSLTVVMCISVMTVGCVHLQYNSSWKCHQLHVEQLLPGRLKKRDTLLMEDGGKGGVREAESDDRKEAWFSINHSIFSDSPPAKLGRTPCRASPPCTVKRVDEVVPHRHLVTQDQTTQVSNKFLDDYRQTYCLQMSN